MISTPTTQDPPLYPRLTCTGESVLQDVVAARVTPGVVPPGLEVVSLPGLLPHPGVPVLGAEDGPHVGGSEAFPAAARRLSAAAPRGGPVPPGRLGAPLGRRLQAAHRPDQHSGALGAPGEPHVGCPRRGVAAALSAHLDAAGGYRGGGLGDRAAGGHVPASLVHHVKHDAVAAGREPPLHGHRQLPRHGAGGDGAWCRGAGRGSLAELGTGWISFHRLS